MSITGKSLGQLWHQFPSGPHYYFWEDFDEETSTSPAEWSGTAIASGTAVMTVDELGGVVRLANNGTDDDSGFQIQTDMELFALQASKELRFLSRLKTSDVTQTSFFVGIAITDTTIQHATTDTLAAGLTITDGIGFYKPDGEATIYGVIVRDSVLVATGTLKALTDATYHVLAFKVEMTDTAGKGTVYFYIDGVELGRNSSTTMPYSSEEILTGALSWKSTEAAANTCDVDSIGVVVDR